MVHDGAIVTMADGGPIESRTWSIEPRHFK